MVGRIVLQIERADVGWKTRRLIDERRRFGEDLEDFDSSTEQSARPKNKVKDPTKNP